MATTKCKTCRRLGVKLFLKGERCVSAKCSTVRKPYPPGNKGKRRARTFSEYAKELREKQKIRNWYNLSERQFAKYVAIALKKRKSVENTAEYLVQELETRLDNVVFRLGFATSHSKARQLVSHRHFLLNGRVVNIPSCAVKVGDKILIKPSSLGKSVFKDLPSTIKKYEAPSWLKLNKVKMEGEVTGKPSLEEASPIAEISTIFEFYSR